MGRESTRALIYAAILGLAYLAYRGNAFGSGTGSRPGADSLSGQPITPTDATTLELIRGGIVGIAR